MARLLFEMWQVLHWLNGAVNLLVMNDHAWAEEFDVMKIKRAKTGIKWIFKRFIFLPVAPLFGFDGCLMLISRPPYFFTF